jgi:cytochrome c oxidase subunit 2
VTSTAAMPALPGPPVTEQGDVMERTWDLYLYLGLAVFAFVFVIIMFVVLRYRKRSEQLPRQKHYNIPAEVTYTVIPFLIIVGLVTVTFVTVGDIRAADDDAPDLVVDVTAFQWQWEFRYPDHDVAVIGGPAPDEPTLVLPSESTIRFNLQSLDVVHSFWITVFRFKRDIIPGSPDTFTVQTDETTGQFPNAGVCAEYCGLDHAYMNFQVEVLPPAEFEAWLDEHATDEEVS